MHSFAMTEKVTRDWLRWQSPEMILITGTFRSLFISNHLCFREMFACRNWISSSNACMVRILRIHFDLCWKCSFQMVISTKHGILQDCCPAYCFCFWWHIIANLEFSFHHHRVLGVLWLCAEISILSLIVTLYSQITLEASFSILFSV